jgi:hypothetical protein
MANGTTPFSHKFRLLPVNLFKREALVLQPQLWYDEGKIRVSGGFPHGALDGIQTGGPVPLLS